MQINWSELSSTLVELVLIPLLGYAALCLRSWIKTKITEMQEKTKSELVKKYTDLLDKTISECIMATNQTYVDALKKENMFDLEAQKKAFKLTYDAVFSILTEDAQKYLSEAVKDLSAYVTNKIEAQISINHQ